MKQLKHMWIFVCMIILTFLGLLVALFKFLKQLAEFELQVRTWRSLVLCLAVCGSLFFGVRLISYGQYLTRETAKDAQQDAHIESTDRRLEDTRTETERRLTSIETLASNTYKEGIAYTTLINQQLKDVTERVRWDEGIGFGLFSGIGIFQAIGAWKRDPPKRPRDYKEHGE